MRKPRKGSAAAAYDSAAGALRPRRRTRRGGRRAARPITAPRCRRLAVNTLIFSVATGLSRIAGLVREVVASSYFGTTGAFSAFTIAFQVPNLVRSLVADAAISAAFVPVFTELLEQNQKREAFRLASNLFFLILAGLGAISALFILLAGNVMPLFTGDTFTRRSTTSPPVSRRCSSRSSSCWA